MIPYRELPTNYEGRDFVVGDLHGMYDLLIAAMESVNFDKKTDRIIALGDLIDRGPKNLEVISLLKEPWFFSVMGNHDYYMVRVLKYYDRKYTMTWMANGGMWSLQVPADELTEYVDLLDDLSLVIKVVSKTGVVYHMVHGQSPVDDISILDREYISGKLYFNAMHDRDMLTNQSPAVIKGTDFIYHGHTYVKERTVLGNRIYIDTGAFAKEGFLHIEELK